MISTGAVRELRRAEPFAPVGSYPRGGRRACSRSAVHSPRLAKSAGREVFARASYDQPPNLAACVSYEHGFINNQNGFMGPTRFNANHRAQQSLHATVSPTAWLIGHDRLRSRIDSSVPSYGSDAGMIYIEWRLSFNGATLPRAVTVTEHSPAPPPRGRIGFVHEPKHA